MKNIRLFVLGVCLLCSYTAYSQLYTQGFNGGSMPAGWNKVITNGTTPAITFEATSTHPVGLTPSEGSHFVTFNSYTCAAGKSIRLYQTTPFATTGGLSGVNVNFDWSTDNTATGKLDRVVVQYSLDGSTWIDVSTYYRDAATALAWTAISCPLPAGAINQANVYIAFHFISGYGTDCHLDNLVINGVSAPALTVNPGTLNFGFTAQGNTSSELSYSLAGFNLVGAPDSILVTAPAHFKISLTSGSGYADSLKVPYSSDNLPSTPIYVVFQPDVEHLNFSETITNSGSGDSKNVTVTGTSWPPYCISTATSVADEEILHVKLGSIDNASNCTSTGGSGSAVNKYSNYRALAPADLMRDATYNFGVAMGTCGAIIYETAVKIFIDYNQDYDFSEANELVYVSPAALDYARYETGEITIPSGAVLGLTMMRVVNVETTDPAAIDSCGTYGWGETEDYTVNILPTPSCLPPSTSKAINFTETTATCNWNENGTATNWQIEYGLRGFTPGSGTKEVATSKPWVLGTLSHSTNYSYRVRSICAPGDTSAWSDFCDFATLCGVEFLPYFENFESVTVPEIPMCFSVTDDNADGIEWTSDDYAPYSGTKCMSIVFNDTSAMNDWFFTPRFLLESGKYYRVGFYYRNDGGTVFPEKLAVHWGSMPNAASMSAGSVFTDENITGNYRMGSGVIHPAATGEYYLGFHGYSDADMDYLVVDDIYFREVPFADLTIVQDDVYLCDTLGWQYPMIRIKNAGQDTVMIGDTITGTYVFNGDAPVTNKFVATQNIYPGDTVLFVFNNQVNLGSLTTYNVSYSISYSNDFNIMNDTVDFIINIGHPHVNLGNDTTVCDNAVVTLNAGNPGSVYLWWDNSTSSIHPVDSSLCGGFGTCSFFVEVADIHGCTGSDTISVTWTSCTGLAENTASNVLILPNPNHGIFTIDFGGMTGPAIIEISDLTGKVVMKETLELTGTEKRALDATGLGKGIYNLRIVNHNTAIWQKIAIQ